MGGTQRLYKVGNWQLSMVDAAMLHHFPFAWEGAVIYKEDLCYTTQLTNDVEVFSTDEEANNFVLSAIEYFKCHPE